MDNYNEHEFTVGATPLPQACSTGTRPYHTASPPVTVSLTETEDGNDSNPAFEVVMDMRKKLSMLDDQVSAVKNSGLHPEVQDSRMYNFVNAATQGLRDSSLPTGQYSTIFEENTFSHILSSSDLDRDEDYCRRNWTGLPHGNFSVTDIQNSNIDPPNFMPMEDSLFSRPMEFMQLSSMPYQPNNPINDGVPKYERRDESRQSTDIPSLKDISRVLKNCDVNTNPNILMNEVLRAGMDHPAHSPNTPKQSPKSAQQVSSNAQQISNSSSYATDSPVTLEDVLIWGSIDLGSTSTKIISLVHSYSTVDIKYTFELEGCEAFQIFCLKPRKKCKRLVNVSLHAKACYQFGIIFLPELTGPAIGTLKITSNVHSTPKYISLFAYGGRSNLILTNLTMNMDRGYGDKSLIVNQDLVLRLTLKNGGTACAFVNLYIENMNEYFLTPDCECILISQGEQKLITIHLTNDKRLLLNLLSFFYGNVAEIGKVTIVYGEEASRRRVKLLCQQYSEDAFVKKVSSTYQRILALPHIRTEYYGLIDTLEFLPLIIQDGFHKMDVPIRINKKTIYDYLDKNNEIVTSDPSNIKMDLPTKLLKFYET